jgi:hypothetical protein
MQKEDLPKTERHKKKASDISLESLQNSSRVDALISGKEKHLK